MTWGMVAVAGATLVGGVMQSNAASKAAKGQQEAAAAAQQTQLEMQKPWIEAGKGALTQLTAGTQPGGQFATQFSMADARNSPAEQEALRAGGEAIQNSAAARGGLLGTNTLQDLTKFGEATGAQYENQAFNQWLANRQANLQPLQSLAGLGQSSTAQVADNVSNLQLASGAAGAGGVVGQANAISGGLSNAAQQFSMLQGILGPSGTGTPVGSTTGWTPASYSLAGSAPSYDTGMPGVGGTGLTAGPTPTLFGQP